MPGGQHRPRYRGKHHRPFGKINITNGRWCYGLSLVIPAVPPAVLRVERSGRTGMPWTPAKLRRCVGTQAGTRLTVAAGPPGSGQSQKARAAGASQIPALRTPARYQTIRDLARLRQRPGQADVTNPQAQDRHQRGKTPGGPAR